MRPESFWIRFSPNFLKNRFGWVVWRPGHSQIDSFKFGSGAGCPSRSAAPGARRPRGSVPYIGADSYIDSRLYMCTVPNGYAALHMCANPYPSDHAATTRPL